MGNVSSSGASQTPSLNNLNEFTVEQGQDNEPALKQIEYFGQHIKTDGSDDLAIDILGNLIANDDEDISQSATNTLIDIYLSPETNKEVKNRIKEAIYHVMDKITDSSQPLFDKKNIVDSRLYYVASVFAKDRYEGQSDQFADSFSQLINTTTTDEELTQLAQNLQQSGRFVTHSELTLFLTQMSDNGNNFLFNDDLMTGKNVDMPSFLENLSTTLNPGQTAFVPVFNKEHWTVIVLEKNDQAEPAGAYYFDSNVVNADDPQSAYASTIREASTIRDTSEGQSPDKNVTLRPKGYCLQVSQEYSAASEATNGCGAFVALLACNIAQSKLATSESTGNVNELIEAIANKPKPTLEQEVRDIRESMILSLLTNYGASLS